MTSTLNTDTKNWGYMTDGNQHYQIDLEPSTLFNAATAAQIVKGLTVALVNVFILILTLNELTVEIFAWHVGRHRLHILRRVQRYDQNEEENTPPPGYEYAEEAV